MNNVPKYLKHSSGQARTVINGKAFYLGKYGSKASKQRYDALIAEWLASNRSNAFGIEAAALTLADLMLAYMKFAKQHYGTGKTSEVHRVKYALRHVRALYTDLAVTEFGPQQFKAIRQRMISEGWARTNINQSMKRILRMIKWGAAEGLYPAAIFETLRLIPSLQKGRSEAKETAPVKPVAEDLVLATLRHCSSVVADMIRVQLLCGCRPGEICKLTPSMIDRSGEVWVATLTEHKTARHGKTRTLYFGPESQKILTPYLLRGDDDKLFRPCDSERKRRASIERTTPLNCGNRAGYNKRSRSGKAAKKQPGVEYDSQSYAKAIKYACDKGGLQRWSPNRLRHTSATMLRAKFGIDAAATILGHSKLETTQVYAEQDREKAIEVAKQVG